MSTLTQAASGSSCEAIVSASWAGDLDDVMSLIDNEASPNCVYANKSALFATSWFGRS